MEQSGQNLKTRALFLFSIGSLFFLCLGIWICKEVTTNAMGILYALIIMLIAIPCHIKGKEYYPLYFASILLNSLGYGFAAGTYYSYFKSNLVLIDFLLPILFFILLTGAVALLSHLLKSSKLFGFLGAVLIFVSLGISLLFAKAEASKQFYLMLVFSVLLFFYYLIYMMARKPGRNTLRMVSFGNFELFVVITYLIVATFTDGGFYIGDVFPDPGAETREKNGRPVV